MSLQKKLAQGLSELGLNLSPEVLEQFSTYQQQLLLWNRAYNLTAITRPEEVLVKHVLDSLAILPLLPEGRLLDVGTGAGLPGLLIAIAQPERPVVLLDSNGKKTRFLTQMVQELKLPNVQVVQGRVEDPAQQQELGKFDVISSRAFASLTDFAGQTGALLKDNGLLAAMKGVVPEDEMTALAPGWHSEALPVRVPFLNEARHLVKLTRQGAQ